MWQGWIPFATFQDGIPPGSRLQATETGGRRHRVTRIIKKVVLAVYLFYWLALLSLLVRPRIALSTCNTAYVQFDIECYIALLYIKLCYIALQWCYIGKVWYGKLGAIKQWPKIPDAQLSSKSSSGIPCPFSFFGGLSYTRHVTSIYFLKTYACIYLGCDMDIQNQKCL